jgi:hypothetical protein
MKNGMNRLDLQAGAELAAYGWTPAQISQRLRVKLAVVEAWMPTLMPEGWAAYRASVRKNRELAATDFKQLSEKEARAQAREQILMEEKIRAEVRAEMATSDAKPKRAKKEENETEEATDASDERRPPRRRRVVED